MIQKPLLSVENLSVEFSSDAGLVKALENVSFQLYHSQTIGLVGESGSGKSVTALSIMGLLPKTSARITSGKIMFEHPNWGTTDLLTLSEAQMQKVRGLYLSMIFQEPMTSLNPVKRCGFQVEEALLWHGVVKPGEARRKVLSLFEEVKLPAPERIFMAWPHELSGGQQQRVMIAMAMACKPALLIADEPTTALDAKIQNNILDLIAHLQTKHGMSVIFITHDLGVVSRIANNVAFMLNGSIVESGQVDLLHRNPTHPYTKALIACRPEQGVRPERLAIVSDFEKADEMSASVPSEQPAERAKRHMAIYSQNPILRIKGLKTHFVTSRNLFGKALKYYEAVDNLSFEVFRGETLGLVGESGSGKTTLGRTIMRLIDPASGQINYRGEELTKLSGKALKDFRRKIQIIFQDPYSSLTPGIQVGKALMEPMRVHRIMSSDKERKKKVIAMLERVNLEEQHFYRYPHEFSGGQRQRIAIARALVLNPEFIICDEPVSALDVSVQAQVLNLLNDLKRDFGLTYLFISHDLTIVRYMSDRIMVLQNGKLIELQEADQLFINPANDYTRELITYYKAGNASTA
ncbi:MAG TPA: ABC transporter ATP-binding protein [Bacteroidales bacterium]|nr:ABC transporter ATP-binding protein [Bacteroidales bacterium]